MHHNTFKAYRETPPLFERDRRVNQKQAQHIKDVWPQYDKRNPLRVTWSRHTGWTRIFYAPPRRLAQIAWNALRNGLKDVATLLYIVR